MEIRPHDGNTPRRKGKLRWKDPDDMEIGKQIKERRESGEAGERERGGERETDRQTDRDRETQRQTETDKQTESLLNANAFYLQSL